MFNLFKNIPVKVNNNDFLVNSLVVSSSNNASPVFLSDDKETSSYCPQNVIGGNFIISYSLTGLDPLKDFLQNEQTPITGNFGGLYFNSGWLRSYSLEVVPNQDIVIQAEIVFFDSLSGTFSGSQQTATPLPIFNSSDIVLEDLSNGSLGDVGGIRKLSYKFASEIEPVVRTDTTTPERVIFGIKEVSVDLETESLIASMNITGQYAGLRLTLWNPQFDDFQESYNISGVITQRQINVNLGEVVTQKINIIQHTITEKPLIFAITPTSGQYGDEIKIYGKNLAETNKIKFTNADAEDFLIINDNVLSTNVPDGTIFGPIVIINNGGLGVSAQNFTLISPGITVDNFTSTGRFNQTIRISGSNFIDIDWVNFSGTTGTSIFTRISTNTIEAIVPTGAAYGTISVGSSLRGVTGYSNSFFTPFPIITGFTPSSGIFPDVIRISGDGFSGATNLLFNSLQSLRFGVVNNQLITGQVPSGNIKGYIRVSGQQNTYGFLETVFVPKVYSNGISSTSGPTGKGVMVSGVNFFPELLNSPDSNNKYVVNFNNGTGLFSRINNSALTGEVPITASSGPVSVWGVDGESYPTTISFSITHDAPTITNVIPYSGKAQDYLKINGSNFFNITNLNVYKNNVVSGIANFSVGNMGDFISFQLPNLTGYYGIQILSSNGNVSGNNQFYCYYSGIISGNNPTSGTVGSAVTISGRNLYPGSKVFLNSGEGQECIVVPGSTNEAYSQLQFVVPNGIPLSNTFVVNNINGYVTGSSTFSFIPIPIISGFTGSQGEFGNVINISGYGLQFISGLKVGNYFADYTIIDTTGVAFTIPEDSASNNIYVYSFAGSGISTNQLTVIVPFVTISGVSGASGFYGDQITISGTRLHTATEVAFSGQSNVLRLSTSNFATIGTTGIRVNVPAGAISGRIVLKNARGETASPDIFTINPTPYISQIFSSGGYWQQVVQLSGSNLNQVDFLFSGPTGNYITSLNTTLISGTGAFITVPREIVSGPIYISGNNRIWGASNQNFAVWPTLNGIVPTGRISGQFVELTGINCLGLFTGFLGLTGNGVIYNVLSGALTRDFRRITGQGITDNTTGYAIISGKLSNIFFGTGFLFLVGNEYADYATSGVLNNSVLRNQITGLVWRNQIFNITAF